MKKTMKQLSSILFMSFAFLCTKAQIYVADFESFTLTPASFYKDTNSVDFQTTNAIFRYEWNTNFDYWSDGFSYTNIHDSVSGGFSNLYNCRPKFGYNASNNYVTAQGGSILVLKAPYDQLDGFYIANTTYTYKSMKNGDSFAKKFGGSTGNDPDWFKITAKGYLNGTMKTDSAVFFLADYRFANNSLDYIVNDWQWFNTSALGQADSIQFFMYSSDVGQFGINTPLYFSIDNLTTSDNVVGLREYHQHGELMAYPNPVKDRLFLQFSSGNEAKWRIVDVMSKETLSGTVSSGHTIDLSSLEKGIYFIEITSGEYTSVKKLIKE